MAPTVALPQERTEGKQMGMKPLKATCQKEQQMLVAERLDLRKKRRRGIAGVHVVYPQSAPSCDPIFDSNINRIL